ncbi:hypothetical protein ACHAWO_003299 [Cyclotella atomus]|uniref:Uncharacterized protein n=1 Tax=Cyclotella atomus TaxID=382360 RepID=A0ABD3Q6A0_9STRA
MKRMIVLSIIVIITSASAFIPQQTIVCKRVTELSMEVKHKRGARVAFVGNSIQYFNDTPRFLTQLCRHETQDSCTLADMPYDAFIEHQDSCFCGGTNLSELWQQGNGMLKHGYRSKEAITGIDEDGNDVYDVGAPTVEDLLQHDWDFVIFNDHTQGPVRKDSRDATIDILVNKYIPLIAHCKAVPVIIETAAYRFEGINNSQDLGTAIEFQKKIRDGILCYIDVLNRELPSVNRPRIAPVGAAFLHVYKENVELWQQLFDSFDNFHPSPKGTFLQGCVLFCTMLGSPPPLPYNEREIASLWKDARMMNPVNRTKGYEIMPFPTVEEAIYFCRVAELIFLAVSELCRCVGVPISCGCVVNKGIVMGFE